MAPSKKQTPDDAPTGRPKAKAKVKKTRAATSAAGDAGKRGETAKSSKPRAVKAKSPKAAPARRTRKAAGEPTEATPPPPAPAPHVAATPPARPIAAPLAPPQPARRPAPAWIAPPAAPAKPAPAARVIPPLPDEDDDPVPFDEGADGAGDDDGEDGDGAPAATGAHPPAPAGDPAGLLEAVRRGERHVSALDQLSDAQLAGLSAGQGWQPRPGGRRSETIYRLLQGRAQPEVPPSTFVEGLLELHPDGYGFLRRPQYHYAQHPHDVYVPAGLVRKHALRPGHWLGGQAHRARPNEPHFALHDVEEVNHEDPSRLANLPKFEQLTVVYPDTRYVLEVAPADVEMRLMDLFCPLGRGQRGLVVAPPRTGKTVILQKLADAISHNSPSADIVVLLVDERPEEVTNLRRSVRGEVIASTFDKPVANHVRVAELVMEKVKRMVEFGRHVVLLLDSITRLGRAYNNLAPTSGRILSGGMDAGALTKPKAFFASARNVEDGGSLTILATALVDTGSRLDTLVFEEFKGSGNMELVLDRDLANQRIWPAINIPASGTRNEDLLLHPEELRRITRLRRAISDHGAVDAMIMLKDLIKQHKTNAELLLTID